MLRAFTLGYLATLRSDCSPRIHPVTVTIDGVAAKHNDTIHERDPMFRLDLSWALHKRREPGRGAVYLRWRLESEPKGAATMAGP